MTTSASRPIRIAAVDPSADPRLAAQLLSVQHASYRIEAELIGVDTIPQLHEDAAGLASSGLGWIAAFEALEAIEGSAASGSSPVLGALAWSARHDAFEIERLVVSPDHFRRGIARRLVGEALRLADGRPVAVSTGRDNPPARRLYESAGFVHLGDAEAAPGVHLAHYEFRG